MAARGVNGSINQFTPFPQFVPPEEAPFYAGRLIEQSQQTITDRTPCTSQARLVRALQVAKKEGLGKRPAGRGEQGNMEAAVPGGEVRFNPRREAGARPFAESQTLLPRTPLATHAIDELIAIARAWLARRRIDGSIDRPGRTGSCARMSATRV